MSGVLNLSIDQQLCESADSPLSTSLGSESTSTLAAARFAGLVLDNSIAFSFHSLFSTFRLSGTGAIFLAVMISPLIASDVDGGKESNIWREAKDFLEEDSEGVSGDFATKGDGFLEDSLEGGEDFLAAVLKASICLVESDVS